MTLTPKTALARSSWIFSMEQSGVFSQTNLWWAIWVHDGLCILYFFWHSKVNSWHVQICVKVTKEFTVLCDHMSLHIFFLLLCVKSVQVFRLIGCKSATFHPGEWCSVSIQECKQLNLWHIGVGMCPTSVCTTNFPREGYNWLVVMAVYVILILISPSKMAHMGILFRNYHNFLHNQPPLLIAVWVICHHHLFAIQSCHLQWHILQWLLESWKIEREER